MPIYRFMVRSAAGSDPRSAGLLQQARLLGFRQLKFIGCQDLYFVEGQLSAEECERLALRLLIDPVTQISTWDELPADGASPDGLSLDVALRPGVTDPVAGELVRAAHELGFDGVRRAATGIRYELDGLHAAEADDLAQRLLANPVIQHWALGEIQPSFPQEIASSGAVELIPLRDLPDEDLLALSKDRRAALDLAELRAIQAYFRSEGREPTDVEFETLAQTWSEHCVHKTFKARIEIREQREVNTEERALTSTFHFPHATLFHLLKSATDEINAPWVRSAFIDNAGILDFDDEYEVSIKVETHNHPSAIESFGGANTGVGGVIRDVLGVSAKPIAATDVLCFGPQDLDPESLPEGVLHPRRVQTGVVGGVQDYGNKIGIPTVNGAILYDEAYAANPLVFCGCVGIAPKGRHPRTPEPGDRVIVLGGRTGRDGLRGATFSSMTMDAKTGEVAGASVQIGDPITEKGLIEVLTRARDLGLYDAVTDCGAGGFSSAVGEMAAATGAQIDLGAARLKYPGLAPWEIWLSEAQERMVLAVPPGNVAALQELCEAFDTELTDIGAFDASGRLTVRYDSARVLDLDNKFLHDGLPQRRLKAIIHHTVRAAEPFAPLRASTGGTPVRDGKGTKDTEHKKKDLCDLRAFVVDPSHTLLNLLAHPNIASKAAVIRIYDHEVQGGTVVKPLTGAQNDGPSDACVIKPLGTQGTRGIVLSNGINPQYGKRDAYRMAWAAVDEAVRNAVAVGAVPTRIALVDNFCWGDPLRPETLGTLVEAAHGCHDAAVHYRTPFVSGKDSLNNEYLGGDGLRHAIPPTLLISALGFSEDVNASVTMDLKEPGDLLYLVGDFQPVFGGSHFSLLNDGLGDDEPVPAPSEIAPRVYGALHAAISADMVRAAHDLSEGGLAVAAAEMCIAGRIGLALALEGEDSARTLFGESNGCLLLEVKPEHAARFEQAFAGLPLLRVGKTLAEPIFSITTKAHSLCSIPVGQLVTSWNSIP